MLPSILPQSMIPREKLVASKYPANKLHKQFVKIILMPGFRMKNVQNAFLSAKNKEKNLNIKIFGIIQVQATSCTGKTGY